MGRAAARHPAFHLPRADHPAAFARFRSRLAPAGWPLVPLGRGRGGGVHLRNARETFFDSGGDPAVAPGLLAAAGLTAEHAGIDDPSRGRLAVRTRGLVCGRE